MPSDLDRIPIRGTGNGADETRADDGTPRILDLELDPPVEFNGKTYTVLHFEEPLAGNVKRAEQELANGASFAALRAYQFALVARTAQVPDSDAMGVPGGVIEKMRISEVDRVFDFLSVFLPGGPGIGGISSRT